MALLCFLKEGQRETKIQIILQEHLFSLCLRVIALLRVMVLENQIGGYRLKNKRNSTEEDILFLSGHHHVIHIKIAVALFQGRCKLKNITCDTDSTKSAVALQLI